MLKNILETFQNCFRIPELRDRILFTLALLAVCRIAAVIPTPGIDNEALRMYFAQRAQQGGMMALISMFTGGAFEHCAIGALGIMPYITATIVLQLLTAVWPTLAKLAREETGRVKFIQYARYLTVLICLGQGWFLALTWTHNPEAIFSGFSGKLVLIDSVFWFALQTAIIQTAGTMLLVWLGEQITERGVGNGVSLVITIGILARLPAAARGLADMFLASGEEARFNLGHLVVLAALFAGVVAGVVVLTQAQRKIPIQYAQRAVGRRVFAGGTSYLPLRLNYTGVMPIIFAQAILMFPGQILSALYVRTRYDLFRDMAQLFQERGTAYLVIYSIAILFFSYFWVATQFNELQIAEDLKKNGAYIPGVRPGQATSDFLHNAMHKITFAGSIFLIVIAILPLVLTWWMGVPPMVASFFGGTSLLITVGVLLDTMRQVETHLMMRHYDGFLKKGRIRGRF